MLNPEQINRLLDLVRSKIPADELEQFCAQNGIGLDIKKVDLSIVIPVYNEEDNIQPLIERLVKAVADITDSYEIIFIDDGSKDETVKRILEMQKKFPGIVLLKLSRNFGQHNAAQAGFDYCHGEAVVWIDADLQEPPEEIPKLLKKLREGYDLVYGLRGNMGGSIFKRLASLTFVRVFNKLSNNPLPVNACTLRIMSKRFVQSINQMPERVRFQAGINSWIGFKRTGIEINYKPRFKGKTKYNLLKMLKMSMDGFLSFSMMPLRVITLFGCLLASFSFLFMALIFFGKILGFLSGVPLGWPSIMISIYFLGRIQCILMGLIGEFFGRIDLDVKSRRLYSKEECYKTLSGR